MTSQFEHERQSTSRTSIHSIYDNFQPLESLKNEKTSSIYIPSTRLHTTDSRFDHCQRRQRELSCYDFCDLCVGDTSATSAWVRYNEERIDRLQKRIDRMLEDDDNDEMKYLLSTSKSKRNSVAQCFDYDLNRKSKHRYQTSRYHNQIRRFKYACFSILSFSIFLVAPLRYDFRFPYRLNRSFLSSPRLLTRNVIRSTIPTAKLIHNFPNKKFISNRTIYHEQASLLRSVPRPILSMVSRNKTMSTSRSRRLVETSHMWKSGSDGKIYILEQFSIPRYYRLYTDVSFREMYRFARSLESYEKQHRITSQDYSSIIRNFALGQQLPTILSVA